MYTAKSIRRVLMLGFLLITIIALLSSCTTTLDKAAPIVITPVPGVKDEVLSTEVASHGLHRITINDSTVILIYRGVESCTMIQLK